MLTDALQRSSDAPSDAAAAPARDHSRLRPQIALGVVAVFLFFTSIDLYAADAWGLPPPSLYIYGCIAGALLLVISQPERLAVLARSPVFAWAIGFFLITTAWGMFIKDVPRVSDDIVDRYRAMALLVALTIVFQEPRVRRAALLTVAAGVVLASLLNVAESFNLLRFMDDPGRVAGRAAGFYVNANGAGSLIVLGTALSASEVPRKWLIPLLLLAGVGVALTFSRGSAVGFALLLVILALTGVVRVGVLLAAVFAAAALLVYYSSDVLHALESAGVLNSNTWARLQLSADDSGRIELAQRAWRMFLDSPLVGSGFGSTVDWDLPERPHNQFLQLATDYGVLGLLAFPLLALTLVLSTRAALPFALMLLIQGFFSHNLVTGRPVTVLFALAAAAAGPRRHGDAPPRNGA